MYEIASITSETLIAAGRVKGANVISLAGEKLGTVDDIIIDKVSGRVIFAVLSFGGFLGMGRKQRSLPWATLNYDDQKGGFVVTLDKGRLEEAPPYDRSREIKKASDHGRTFGNYYRYRNAPSNWG